MRSREAAAPVVARPVVRWLPPPLVAGTGLFLTVGIIVYAALARAPFDPRLAGAAVLGMVLQVAAPFLDRGARIPRRASRVAGLVACAAAMTAVPLLVLAIVAA
jgi:hypothetical protein